MKSIWVTSPLKRYGTFMIVYAVPLNVFLTGEYFCFHLALMRAKPYACDFMYLIIGRTYHGLASGSVYFNP